jgi:hypothetical protein
VATAAATALTVFVLGALLETWLISVLQPSEGELTWISDLFLAGCLGVAIYLWLDLRFTRAACIVVRFDERPAVNSDSYDRTKTSSSIHWVEMVTALLRVEAWR